MDVVSRDSEGRRTGTAPAISVNERLQPIPALVASIVLLALAPATGRAADRFIWRQGDPSPKVIAKASNSVCVLTMVTGKFRGAGEDVRLINDGTDWQIQGQSGQEGVSAGAHCFPLASFVRPGGVVNGGERVSQQWEGSNAESCVENLGPVGPWNAVAFISRIGGEFRGGGEYLRVDQSGTPGTDTWYHSSTCRANSQMVFGVSTLAFQDKISTGALQFSGPKGSRVRADLAGVYEIGPNQALPMARTDEAVCYFTHIAGEFNGADEEVRIEQQEDENGVIRWFLSTRSHTGDGTWAGARCLYFAQWKLGPLLLKKQP